MGKLIDLTGQQIGRLTVINQAATVNRTAYWNCSCECGSMVTVRAGSLLKGYTKSCGCYRRDAARKRATIHGLYNEPLRAVWHMMKQRCHNPQNKDYKYYGALGVSVCADWSEYLIFRKWAMSNGYDAGLSIDRLDPKGNYEPTNCRWITIQDQQKTRRPRGTVAQKKCD